MLDAARQCPRSLPAIAFAWLVLGVEILVTWGVWAIGSRLPGDALLAEMAWRRAWEDGLVGRWMVVNVLLAVFLWAGARGATPAGRLALLATTVAAAAVQAYLARWAVLPPPAWRVVDVIRF